MDIREFIPELELELHEQGELASMMAHPGFVVFRKLGKNCADQFILRAINTNESETDEMITRMRLAKVAAQYHTMFMNLLVNIVGEYVSSQPSDKIIESATALDLGEHTPYGADLIEESY